MANKYWQRPKKPKRIDSPAQREKMDRYLEKYGLLNYQTEGLSTQDIADRYARARVKVQDNWFEQNYDAPKPDPSWYNQPTQPAPQQSQSLQINYSTAPNGLLIKQKTTQPAASPTFQPTRPLTQLQIAAGYGYEPTKYDTGKISNAPATIQDAVSGNANWSDVEVDQRQKALSDPGFYASGAIMKYPKWMQQQILADPAFKWEKLPKWQKLYYEVSSSPASMGAAQGALLGLGGGPAGGAIGAGVGAGLGYVAAKSGYDPLKEAWQQKGVAAGVFGWLNFLAEFAEKSIGLGVQTIGAAVDPNQNVADLYKDAGNAINPFDDKAWSAWNTGAITYETLGPAVAEAIKVDVRDLKGSDFLMAVPTVFYVKQLTDLMLNPEKYKGQEMILGANEPIDLEQTFQERITEARERIKGGENYRAVMQDFQNGVVGQISDMAGQALADPLNVMPRVETGAMKAVADVTGNKVASEALRTASGPMQAARTYKTLVQTGQALTIDPSFKVDTMGAFSRFVAGVNEQGQVRAGPFTRAGLLDTPTPRKNLAGFVQEMTSLTPQSRAQIGASMFYENIGALLTRFDDPHEAGKYLKALSNSDMETWKELGSRFADSPEFYTVLPALKAYNGSVLDGIVQTWDMSAPNRDMLTRVAEVLGDSPSKLLDDLAARGTAEQDFQRMVTRLQQSDTDAARLILGDVQAGRFNADSLKQIVDVFTGDGALPWHPGQWKAMMLDSLGSHFDEFVTNRLMLDQTPEAKSAFFRTAALMKTAQSILLLGASPGYAITNGLSNMLHRAASGVFGYLTPDQINGWMDRFGTTPARFEEGVGIGGMVDQASTSTGVITEAQQKAVKGTGTLADAKDKLSRLSKGMPFSKLSSWMEKSEGRQAFSIAMKQFWSQSWRRGVGFRSMDPQLTKVVQGMGIDPGRIYAAIEAGMNQGEIEKALYGRFEGVQTRALVDDAARRTGLTPQQAADLLEKVGVLDTLDGYLKGQTTPDGIQSAFRRADQIAQDRLDLQTGEDLKAIAEHVRQKVGLEGAASGLDVVQRVDSTRFDAWMDHFFRLGEVMSDLSTLDDPAMKSKAIETQYSISDAEFRRINARTAANYQGIFDAWGRSGSPKAMEMLSAIAQSDSAMKQAYDFMRTERRQFFDGGRPIEEWSASQTLIDAEFQRAFKSKHDAEVRMGQSLGSIYGDLYGPAAGEAARKWWEDVTKFNDDIVKREQKARREFAQMPKQQREAAKQKYYRETKILLIAEAEKINQEGITRLERVVRKGGGRGATGTEALPSPASTTRPSEAEEINGLVARAEQRQSADTAARAEQVNGVWGIAEGYTREGELYNRGVTRDRFALLGALRKKEYGGIKDLTGLDDPRLTPEFIRDVMEKRAQIKAGEEPTQQPSFNLSSWQKDFDAVVQSGNMTRMIDLFESFPPEKANDLAPTGETFDAFMVRSWEETAARAETDTREQSVAEAMHRADQATAEMEAQAEQLPETPPVPTVKRNLKAIRSGTAAEGDVLADANQPVGALDAASQFTPHSEALDQGWSQFVRPLLDAMQEGAVRQLDERPLDGAVRDLASEGQAQLKRYVKQVQGDMATSKLATMRYGEQQRDFAMLNYSKQYGFDRWTQVGWPYELYSTRSFITWAARGIDAPAWFSNYARLNMQQQRYERDIPERLRGKIKIPAPWMPDWMGDALYIDPLRNLFFPAGIVNYFQRKEQETTQQELEAERILQEWSADGSVSDADIQQAMNREGSAWERAFAEAQIRREAEAASPLDFFSTMLGPAWYLTAPYYLATGKGRQPSTLPLTNTARALDTVTQGTWAEPIGDVLGLLGKPEEWARKKAGLPTMGEYGEYYQKRQVANMVAEGLISSEEAQLAMIEKQGEVWENAGERVRMELALRVPTAGALYAGLHEGPQAFAQAALPSLFGSGLLPAGELEYRGLKQEWNEAWKKYDAGDTGAVNTFFDEHPEYEAYLAKGKGDDELMKSFMIGQIWNGYMELGTTNQKQARSEMGELFQQAFLDKETRSYESIDTETLIQWAQQLNQKVPQAVNAQPLEVTQPPNLDLYSEDVTRVTDEFFSQRTKNHGNYYELEQGYFALPKSQRSSYLLKNPELKEYWDFKDQWYKGFPELEPIFRGQVFKEIDTSAWPPGLTDYVEAYAYTGKKLSTGAYKALEQQWIIEGRPYDDLNTWLNSQVVPAMLYQGQQ